MKEQKFIAISEDEYNSFKYGEYERKIKTLEQHIKDLEDEKIKIAEAKAIRLEITNDPSIFNVKRKIKVLSDEAFENEILESIRNTPFSHIVSDIGNFVDYVIVGDTTYYKNTWCEKLKNELAWLSSEIESLKKTKKDLQEKIDILKEGTKEIKNDNSFIDLIVNRFSKLSNDQK